MSDTPTFLSFCARITPESTQRLFRVCAELANGGVEAVHLLLSSPGGSVESGVAAYNLLRGMPFRLTTHNVGRVDSMGNALFLAGEQRFACRNSSFMFHGVGFNVSAKMRFDARHLREKMDSVLDDQRKIAMILADRTRLAPETIDALFRETVTRDPAYALENGIVHDVREVSIPGGARIVPIESRSS